MRKRDSMKEVYDGIKKLITITEKIGGHTQDIAEITGDIVAIKENVTENSRGITEIKGNVGEYSDCWTRWKGGWIL